MRNAASTELSAPRLLAPRLLAVALSFAGAGLSHAAAVTEEFQVEGLVSPASPKALAAALEERLAVKVVGYQLRDTASGWPVVRVEFEEGAVTRDEIAAVIDDTEDPTGRMFRVYAGPPRLSVALLAEETTADGVLGDPASEAPALVNPVEATSESLARGKALYTGKCDKCHGADGNGTGPSTHGIDADPRKLWVWSSAGDAADGYLFSIISNGRTDMPPWGLVLSETERWDLVNYVKTLKAPQ
ncbi:MAG: cytochrome c [Gammaproteobacteria bacterium]|nr:cytochrome c [Gammaproteobacteria bacterium]